MDRTTTGRVKCTLVNWTGVAYKIPRLEMDKCKNREGIIYRPQEHKKD